MIPLDRLAFVDLETSGLSPSRDRITEIGVITVDDSGIHQWTTLLNPGMRPSAHPRTFSGIPCHVMVEAPRFRDIAAALFERLNGRLFIAHNARFDFGFLKAGFQRLGMEFQPQVLCSVMLSRKLYAQFPRHDLDSLVARHALTAGPRHRALPDAQLLWQFWQVLRMEHARSKLNEVIDSLLAGPILPPHLDPALIERLPEMPGVYVLHGDNGVLHAGKAANLKLHLLDYFRLDRSSRKALDISYRVIDISWKTTRGAIGNHLQLRALADDTVPVENFTWRLKPDAYPCIELIAVTERRADDECCGVFASSRKAHNALLRLAAANNLCHALLGIVEAAAPLCTGCAVDRVQHCSGKTDRLRQFTKVLAAVAPLRLAKWPYQGPIGIKERGDLHIIEDWRYLGTAQNDSEVHQVLATRPQDFDENTFAFMAKALARLPSKRIVELGCLPGMVRAVSDDPTDVVRDDALAA